MPNKIIFLNNTSGFMSGAVISNLEENGFMVTQVKPSRSLVLEDRHKSNIFLAYLDSEENNGFPEMLIRIEDYATESKTPVLVYLIGTPIEIEEAKEIISPDLVAGSFTRPINVKELVEKINNDLKSSGDKAPKKRVLVVDDDPNMLNALNAWFSPKYQVYMADSGMNAISLIARHKVDLILLDYEMPVISGAKVLEMLRSERETKDIPVMFLTAKGDRFHVMKVMELKPEKYLLKSQSPEELIAQVDEYFAKHP
ncbi:MAG: response regulator [Eubacterium sp.]|nr:response regulator [Eubacterium sp.]